MPPRAYKIAQNASKIPQGAVQREAQRNRGAFQEVLCRTRSTELVQTCSQRREGAVSARNARDACKATLEVGALAQRLLARLARGRAVGPLHLELVSIDQRHTFYTKFSLLRFRFDNFRG